MTRRPRSWWTSRWWSSTELQITRQQRAFIDTDAQEVLFGGAAGGGKSYGQLIDALLYALKYPGRRQLILRRTYLELERSLILVHLGMYPREIYTYNAGAHRGRFANSSTIEFGYCDSERDVYRYQSAEYDVIRFDELTHFSEDMYLYLMSRLRGSKPYPRSIKSTTNPGGVGHYWVKARFIDPAPPGELIDGKRLFIPAKVQDNRFLMAADPGYIDRLKQMSEQDQRALLYGEWDIYEGMYFTEFDRSLHVVKPFPLPDEWARYFAMDYGLDMLAGYWIAVDPQGRAYVYREIYRSGLIISDAARAILSMTQEPISAYIAPPDLWNRRQDTGRSAAEIFASEGMPLSKARNDRVQGWYDLKEWLRPCVDEVGERAAGLRIFDTCRELIRCLPSVVHDKTNPNDVSTEPHELTHAPDAIRYFCAGRPVPALVRQPVDGDFPDDDTQIDSFLYYGR